MIYTEMKLLHHGRWILALTLFVSSFQSAIAQIKMYGDYTKVEIGYTSTFLSSDQGATLSIFSARNDSTFVTGSSFIGAQSGLSARMNFEFGEKNRYIIPIGFDMTFMRGLQRLENPGISGHGSVSSNMTTIVAGLQYRFYDLPLAEAFLYGGLETRGSFVSGSRFIYEVTKTDGSPIPQFNQDTVLKSNVFRFGGALRAGVQGIISEPLRINISWAYGINNLFGRDLRASGKERRGQLLTPTRINETEEGFSKFLQFSLWLQYHF